MLRAFCIAVLLIAVSGCARQIDGEQLRICRLVLPALYPETSEIHEVNAARSERAGHGIEVRYTAHEPGGRVRTHETRCEFGGGVFDAGRLDLIGVETDGEALSEARLVYLKRFWLSAFGVAAEEARRAETIPDVLQLPPAAAYAVQQLVNALALAAIYGLLATAYSLIYGLIGRINFAFGAITVVGAYGAIGAVAVLANAGGFGVFGNLTGALVIAGLFAALWSWFVGRTVIAPLHARHRLGQPVLVATIAVAIALQEGLRLFQGARDLWLPPIFNEPLALARAGNFVVTVTAMELVVVCIALAASCGVLWFLARSRFGRQWRAFADDPAAAELLGVAPRRVLALTFGLAGTLAGLSGWIVAVYYGNVGFAMSTMLGLKALVAAILGGIGSVPGAFLGGILVAMLEGLWSAYFDVGARDIVVYSILIVVFVLRPGGLLGFSNPSPREI